MQAAQVMAGYTLGGADLLRRAMGKKDKEKMAKEREKFREGCARLHGIKAAVADEVFDTLEKFAGYGFNRSHSAAYAWVSYQTAYLKANYPVEFMAAVMSNEVSNTDKISVFVGECERLGIDILPPDLNKAGLKFEPDAVNGDGVAALKALRRRAEAGEAAVAEESVRFEDLPAGKPPSAAPEKPHLGAIRYGLAAIKNVGEGAMIATVEERQRGGAFTSLHDFCGRVDARKINKKAVEALVKCGAFDFTGGERAQLFSEIDGAMAAAASAHRDRASGQVSMFDAFEAAPPKPVKSTASKIAPWSHTEKLAFEKELLGFYVTGHPLDEYRSELAKSKYVPIARLPEQEPKSTVTIAGALTSVEKKFTKKDSKPFAVVVVEDLTEQLEVMIWSEAYTRSQQHLVQGNVVAITGRLDIREEGPRVSADEVKIIRKPAATDRPLLLTFQHERTTEDDLRTVREIVRLHPGPRRIELCFIMADGRRLRLRSGEDFRVALTPGTEAKLAPWLQPVA
jgi:DNA polymerase-3 subunit alpha